jgi:hypothetical protein
VSEEDAFLEANKKFEIEKMKNRDVNDIDKSTTTSFYKTKRDLYFKIFKAKIKKFEVLRNTFGLQKLSKAEVYRGRHPKAEDDPPKVEPPTQKIGSINEVKNMELILKDYYESFGEVHAKLMKFHKMKIGTYQELGKLRKEIKETREKKAKESIKRKQNIRQNRILRRNEVNMDTSIAGSDKKSGDKSDTRKGPRLRRKRTMKSFKTAKSRKSFKVNLYALNDRQGTSRSWRTKTKAAWTQSWPSWWTAKNS